MSFIGKAIISLLSNQDRLTATEDKYTYIASHTVSQNEILAVFEKATGSQWTVEKVDSEEAGRKATEGFKNGDYSTIPDLIRTVFLASSELGNWEKIGLSNDVLGLQKEDLEADVKGALAKV